MGVTQVRVSPTPRSFVHRGRGCISLGDFTGFAESGYVNLKSSLCISQRYLFIKVFLSLFEVIFCEILSPFHRSLLVWVLSCRSCWLKAITLYCVDTWTLRHSNMLWRHLLSLRWRLIANFASVKLSEFEPAARVSSALEINARNTCSGRLLRIYYYLISGHMLSNHVSVGVVRTLGHQTRWFVKFVAFANVAPA